MMIGLSVMILWLKNKKPDVFKKIRNILHFPQYLSYLFTGKICSEYTSIGCHTAIWDFDNMQYHPWLKDQGIVLPDPIPNDTFFLMSQFFFSKTEYLLIKRYLRQR